MFCPVTGDYPCQCKDKLAVTEIGAALLTDMKAVLRKLFSDHVNYTSLVVRSSVPQELPEAAADVKRLLKNPIDIANLLVNVVGAPLATEIKDAFTQHLILANSALKPVREGNTAGVQRAVAQFYEQGNTLADSLSKLNPSKLPQDYVLKLIREHNEFVVKLATLRQQRKYEEYNETFDKYYKHMLALADAVAESLTA